MRTPKISTKRVLGVALAAAMAVSGTVAFASSSEAAVLALKLSPATGSEVGGSIVTITGSGFKTAAGVSKVGVVGFMTGSCVAGSTTDDATVTSVASATKIVITTPALSLTASKPTVYNLCVENVAGDAVLGTAKFTSYPAPTVVAVGGLSSTSGASYGGGTLTITGDDFTAKTTAKIGGVALTGVKVVPGPSTDDDTLTGTIPAGSGATKAVIVTSEGGSVTATETFSYVDAVKVSPTVGFGNDNDVISLDGVGFEARNFSTAVTVGNTAIALVPAGTNLAAAQAVPVTRLCDTVQVESDTALTCQLAGAIAVDGPYTVVLLTRAATATNIATSTAISADATYTISNF